MIAAKGSTATAPPQAWVLRLAQAASQALQQGPRDLGMGEDEGTELPRGHRREHHVGLRRDRGGARPVGIEQGKLADVLAASERRDLLPAHGDARLPFEDEEEGDAAGALADDGVARRHAALGEVGGEPRQV